MFSSEDSPRMRGLKRFTLLLPALVMIAASVASAQLSDSAYRVLGQPDLRQNGVNRVQGVELSSPVGVAVDVSGNGQVPIYISDTANSRVLAWRDARSYQIGEPPHLILGQPGPQYSQPSGIGPKGFNAPLGIAVDPRTRNLYVADFGKNRVLRFPDPFAHPSRVEPDAVYGQPNFTSTAPGTTRNSMNGPRAVAFDSAGNLWVADTGNHRILRFSAASLNDLTSPDADAVIGQPDFFSGGTNRSSGTISARGFNTPAGLVFDAQDNLYVADFNNNRVLKFSGPLTPPGFNFAASEVIGQPDFTTGTPPLEASNSTLHGPAGLGADHSGKLLVAVPADHRVLVFSITTLTKGAVSVFGQSDFLATTPNTGVSPQASPNTLYGPSAVTAAADGNVYIADTGNNRVLGYPNGSKSATQVWGQSNFSSNGPNQVKPGSLNHPFKIAVDYTQTPYALYVSDTANHRVLVWRDAVRFRNGDPADMVIGQPDLRTAIPNVDTRGSETPTSTSLSSPSGVVVDPRTGDLFVADTGNNRVLRFPRPVDQSGRITPDAVIGQVDFNSSVSAVVSASSLHAPTGIAIAPDGNFFVADTGNNRVLEFDSVSRPAVRVYGQPNFTSSVGGGPVSAQTLSAPRGLFVDTAYNLFVADTGANRVLVFPDTQGAPIAGMAASFVIGQPRFDTVGGGSGTGLHFPTDIALDKRGRIYVADNGHHRVLEFPSLVFLPVTNATAVGVVGQQSVGGTSPNWNSPDGLATAEGLSEPTGIYFDRQGTLYVADSGNNRVVHFLKPAVAVNAATFQASVPIAQGGLASLFGAGITEKPEDVAVAGDPPWPAALLNRQVIINDETIAPLYYLSASQVNLQLPSLAPTGSDRIAVRVADTGELIAGGSVLVARTSPGLFTAGSNGQGQGAIVNEDGKINGSANPASRGSVVSLYGTGQGQVTPAVPDGTAAPSNPLSVTVSVPTTDGGVCISSPLSMCVAIGTKFAEVQYSGLAPGYVGLWQINVKIPEDIVPGAAVPLRVVINGTPSNVVTVAVQ